MPANPSTSEMGRRHVERAAEALGAVPSAGSGNRWQNPADGRSPHDGPYAIVIEGKSTRGKSITVTLEMIAKLREQSLGENPVLPLCWYGTDDLTVITEDWAVVPLDFLAEILVSARAWAVLETALGSVSRDDLAALIEKSKMTDGLAVSLRQAETDLLDAGERIAAKDLELEALRAQARSPAPAAQPEAAQFVPQLPWTVVRVFPPAQQATAKGAAGEPVVGRAVYYAPDGSQLPYDVHESRVQRSMANRPQIFVDKVRVKDADLYRADGSLLARCWEANPSAEFG